jgi:hypothetical protein
MQFVFFCFLFAVLSLGRAFSVLHINIASTQLFITEIVILISLPLLIVKRKQILELPLAFLSVLTAYFLFGCFYLFSGLLSGNIFALRDIVFCVYILFLPLALVIFSQQRNLKFFLLILLLADLIGILVGRLWIFEIYPSTLLRDFLSKTREFNLGVYYGIAISFLISFYSVLRYKRHKIITLVLLSLNLYMSLVFGKRTLWFACIALFVFYGLIMRAKFLRMLIALVPIFLFVSGVLCYIDFKPARGIEQKEVITSKAKTLALFHKELLGSPKVKDLALRLNSKDSESYGNIKWRVSIWEQSIKFGLSSPLLGRGFGVYPEYTVKAQKLLGPTKPGEGSNVTPCHNHLISIFMKMGLLGLSLFLFISVFTFVYGLRYIKHCKNEFLKCFLTASLGAFLFWHAIALFFDAIDSPPTSIFIWIIAGLIFAAVRADKQAKLHE